ncbi:TRAP transporter large permease [Alteribacillus bidgolensis]|uniref:TRAP transporter, DctM subunit n=1 Tax=Alteribacillus bidgolensis TaxID=930129 RepID=A0A1G8HFG8_9BACI|nr:TRAP transporter large permease [Alteribacillus bidgolensis]SDI05325.1 TRAP transporter, DctM subunit [Alteribacillus bidgolensis]
MIAAIAFFLLLLLGVPIAFVLGLTTLIFVISTGNIAVFESMPSRMYNGLQTFGLVAIPMFILLGEVMNRGGITERLIEFCQTILAHLRGGLAYVNVLANMALASIVGSANAQTAIMSKTMVPSMEKEGYKREFSTALTASSSIIGPLIPPSMPFIVYGVTAGVSIGSLFLAGIVPGIFFGLGFSIAIYFIAKKQNLPTSEKSEWTHILKSTLNVLPALIIPVFILVGITTGAFTATESAAVAVFIAFLVGFFFYKQLKLKDLPKLFFQTVITSSAVTFLLATSNIFGWVLSVQRVPQMVAEVFLGLTENPLIFLLLINILLLIIGMVIDGLAALILLTPILLPIAVQFGVDPIHFGVIMVINLTLGLMTPPVGTVLFIASSTAKVKVETLIRSIAPFLIISFVILLIITYMPWTSLSIPTLFNR